ncbi:MAG: hypothetical protein M0Q38_15475 [Bacteroidales bacterium]|jgi:predicted RNase H-like HicB family nuclease|nr:hypothetical protein [Bacteroidales bacterium]
MNTEKTGSLYGKWGGAGHQIKVKVPLIAFTEDNSFIIYCPVFDLSGYGKTESEAEQSLTTVMDEFFKYTVHKNTLRSVLKDLGWVVKKSKQKPMAPPSMDNILKNNADFLKIFNNHEFRKFDKNIEVPVC